MFIPFESWWNWFMVLVVVVGSLVGDRVVVGSLVGDRVVVGLLINSGVDHHSSTSWVDHHSSTSWVDHHSSTSGDDHHCQYDIFVHIDNRDN